MESTLVCVDVESSRSSSKHQVKDLIIRFLAQFARTRHSSIRIQVGIRSGRACRHARILCRSLSRLSVVRRRFPFIGISARLFDTLHRNRLEGRISCDTGIRLRRCVVVRIADERIVDDVRTISHSIEDGIRLIDEIHLEPNEVSDLFGVPADRNAE